VRRPRRFAEVLGTLLLHGGSDRIVFGTGGMQAHPQPILEAVARLELPDELTQILKENAKLAKAFHALTPGRQRGYVLHFNGAKRSETRTARVEKCIPQILAGLGMHDE